MVPLVQLYGTCVSIQSSADDHVAARYSDKGIQRETIRIRHNGFIVKINLGIGRDKLERKYMVYVGTEMPNKVKRITLHECSRTRRTVRLIRDANAVLYLIYPVILSSGPDLVKPEYNSCLEHRRKL